MVLSLFEEFLAVVDHYLYMLLHIILCCSLSIANSLWLKFSFGLEMSEV